MMRKVIVISMISLDGVLQAPGAPEEDTSGGFRYGGWVAPYDDDNDKSMAEQMKPLISYWGGRPSTYLPTTGRSTPTTGRVSMK